MNKYINTFSCRYISNKLLVRSTGVGLNISYFQKQTEEILIRQLKSCLTWVYYVCKSVKRCLYEIKGKAYFVDNLVNVKVYAEKTSNDYNHAFYDIV